jgi:hypothetical protein
VPGAVPVVVPGVVASVGGVPSSLDARHDSGAGASPSCPPQLTQNFVPSMLLVPQFAQTAISFSFDCSCD